MVAWLSVRSAWSRLIGGRKVSDSWFMRWWASHRAEDLVKQHGVDVATEILRLTAALCAEPPMPERLPVVLRMPFNDGTGLNAVEARTLANWNESPTARADGGRPDINANIPEGNLHLPFVAAQLSVVVWDTMTRELSAVIDHELRPYRPVAPGPTRPAGAPAEPYAFISFSHDGADYAGCLTEHLASAGVTAWYDRYLPAGEKLSAVIQTRIARCAVVLVILTPDAVKSDWVERELAYAQDLNKPIIPLMLIRCHEPMRIAELKYEDVTHRGMPTPAWLGNLKRRLVGDSSEASPTA